MINLGKIRVGVLVFLRGLAGLLERIQVRWLGRGRPRIGMCDKVEEPVSEPQKSAKQREDATFGAVARGGAPSVVVGTADVRESGHDPLDCLTPAEAHGSGGGRCAVHGRKPGPD